MLTIKQFILNFISRAGNYVLISTVFARLLSFLASWIALQFVDNEPLGIVIYAFNIVSFFIPLGGLGLHQSLLRYGALTKKDNEKKSLFIYTFKKGIRITLILISLIIGVSFLFEFSFDATRYYLILLSVVILPLYVMELIKIQCRIYLKNKKFALIEFVYNVLLVLLVLVLSYFYQEAGYAVALLFAPTLVILLFWKSLKINFKGYQKLPIVNLSFYKYGFFASLSNVVTQLLVIIDIFLIGYLIKDPEQVTFYKYISLIPFSLLFLPRVFVTTDFVAFTEKIYDQQYIKNYIKGYLQFFITISIFLVGISYLFSEDILKIFGEEFISYHETFFILILGVTGILICRGLFGNLLSSLGKAHINYYIVSIALLLNIALNLYLIPTYGIKGAAITSTLIMWLTGLASAFIFYKLYNRLK